MKVSKINIAMIFFASTSSIYGQSLMNDTTRKEKEIEQVIINGVSKKGTEAHLMSTQRKSAEIIERVGSAQLSKQGVSDVAVAVTKATGAQKQEGTGEVFIRGLGDRNNATTLNGLPIPSNDPLFKNIDLSIIKADMIDFVGLEKVYHPRLWGDMSGANVDISSKVYVGKPYFKINFGSSINFNAIKKNHFYLQNGPHYFGFKEISKPKNASILALGFPFTTSWKNKEINTPINTSLNFDFGRSFNMGQEGKLSIFGYGAFENDYSYVNGLFGGSFSSQGNALKIYDNAEEFKYQTNTTGLLNVHYKINTNHNFNYTSNYIHTTEQKLGQYAGYNRDYYDNDPLQEQFITQMRRATYRINDLFINQLRGEHQISNTFKLNWNVGLNRLDSRRPDRQQNVSVYDKKSTTNFFASSNPGANNRYYDSLIENDFVGNINAEYQLNENFKFYFGYNGRLKNSDFRATQYNFRVKASQGNYFVDANNYDSFFNLSNYQTGAYFDVVTFRGDIQYNPQTALIPQFFSSEIMNNAGYINFDYKMNEKLSGQVGVRFDQLEQQMKYNTALLSNGGEIEKNYQKILPSLNIKYSINDQQNLRLAASKTYTTPLLLEMAPFEYEDVDESSIGNATLYPQDNYNLDLKWEWFPTKNEVISLTAFGKYIQNPIARITIASSSNTVSFANVGDKGKVYGAELEIRKDIFNSENSRFYTFFNATYLNTQQDLDSQKLSNENTYVSGNFIKNKDKMQGASDFLVNANLGWEKKWNHHSFDLVIAYSYISDNIYSLGFEGRGNMVDKSIHTLDTVAKLKLNNGIGLSISAKNLLNPTYERIQANELGDLTTRAFKKGINTGVGISYEF